MDLTPRIDLVFKKLFGVDENKDLLISLINSIVCKEDQIASVEILNPYSAIDFRDQKLSVLDIKAKGNNGQYYNIEIQVADEKDYDKKALTYWAKLYTSQLKKGDPYSKLNKTIGIHILNFLSIPKSPDYHHFFNLRDNKHNIHYFKDIELHTIELIKFGQVEAKEYRDASDALKRLLPLIKTSLDRWVTFLGKYEFLNSKNLPKELKDPYVEKAFEIIEHMDLNEDEREIYESHLNWLRVEMSALEKAEEKGMAKGRAEGLAEGEAKEKMHIIIKMLKNNMDINLIGELTGVSIEEIKALKKQS